METQPPRDRIESPPQWFERMLCGLLGIVGVPFATWFTLVWVFVATMGAPGCSGPTDAAEILLGAAVYAGFALGAALLWCLAISFLLVAAGRRALRRRSWIAVIVLFIGCSWAFLALAEIASHGGRVEPPTGCSELQLH